MENNTSEDNCDCPKECSYISYSFTLESTEFDPKEVCPDIFGGGFDEYKNFVMKPFYEHKYPAQFVRSLRSIQSNVSNTTFGPISVEYYPMWWRVLFFLLLVWLVSYCWVTCQPIRCQYCNVWTNHMSVLPTPPRGTWLPPTAGSGCGTEGSSPSSLQQRV